MMADESGCRATFSSSPRSGRPHPRKRMLMTPWLVFFGGIFAFAVPTLMAAFCQMMFFNAPVSSNTGRP